MRILSIILFSTIFAEVSFCQSKISIKSGINIATTKDLIAFPQNRLGWYGGINSNFPISSKLSIEPELIYSSKGYSYTDLSNGKTVTMRLNYLNMPLLLRYRIDTKTYILGGGELGYLMKAINAFDNDKDDATASFPKKFDFGLAIGLQYNIIEQLGLEIRYIYGFNGFYQTDAVGIRRSESLAANRVFQIGINYYLFE